MFFQAKAVCVGMSSHRACIQTQHWRPRKNDNKTSDSHQLHWTPKPPETVRDQRSCTVARWRRAASGVNVKPWRKSTHPKFSIWIPVIQGQFPEVDYEWHPRDAALLDSQLMVKCFSRALWKSHQPMRIKEIINFKIAAELAGTEVMINSYIPLTPNH